MRYATAVQAVNPDSIAGPIALPMQMNAQADAFRVIYAMLKPEISAGHLQHYPPASTLDPP